MVYSERGKGHSRLFGKISGGFSGLLRNFRGRKTEYPGAQERRLHLFGCGKTAVSGLSCAPFSMRPFSLLALFAGLPGALGCLCSKLSRHEPGTSVRRGGNSCPAGTFAFWRSLKRKGSSICAFIVIWYELCAIFFTFLPCQTWTSALEYKLFMDTSTFLGANCVDSFVKKVLSFRGGTTEWQK